MVKRKLFSYFGAITLITTPIVMVVSCGEKETIVYGDMVLYEETVKLKDTLFVTTLVDQVASDVVDVSESNFYSVEQLGITEICNNPKINYSFVPKSVADDLGGMSVNALLVNKETDSKMEVNYYITGYKKVSFDVAKYSNILVNDKTLNVSETSPIRYQRYLELGQTYTFKDLKFKELEIPESELKNISFEYFYKKRLSEDRAMFDITISQHSTDDTKVLSKTISDVHVMNFSYYIDPTQPQTPTELFIDGLESNGTIHIDLLQIGMSYSYDDLEIETYFTNDEKAVITNSRPTFKTLSKEYEIGLAHFEVTYLEKNQEKVMYIEISNFFVKYGRQKLEKRRLSSTTAIWKSEKSQEELRIGNKHTSYELGLSGYLYNRTSWTDYTDFTILSKNMEQGYIEVSFGIKDTKNTTWQYLYTTHKIQMHSKMSFQKTMDGYLDEVNDKVVPEYFSVMTAEEFVWNMTKQEQVDALNEYIFGGAHKLNYSVASFDKIKNEVELNVTTGSWFSRRIILKGFKTWTNFYDSEVLYADSITNWTPVDSIKTKYPHEVNLNFNHIKELLPREANAHGYKVTTLNKDDTEGTITIRITLSSNEKAKTYDNIVLSGFKSYKETMANEETWLKSKASFAINPLYGQVYSDTGFALAYATSINSITELNDRNKLGLMNGTKYMFTKISHDRPAGVVAVKIRVIGGTLEFEHIVNITGFKTY